MIAPVEIADAVELWARNSGRHARLQWVPQMPAWVIKLSAKPDDPRMKQYQEGLLDEEPFEPVYLMEWNTEKHVYEPLNLDDLGATGVVELLQKGDTWSGRGEYRNMNEAVMAQVERTRRTREENRKRVREMGEAAGDLTRRHFLELPQVPVTRDVTPSTASEDT